MCVSWNEGRAAWLQIQSRCPTFRSLDVASAPAGPVMKRLVLCVTFATLFLRSHPAADPPPLIEWQPATAPFGGDAEATVTHGRLLLVRTRGYGHPVWWMSPDRGASWQQTLPRLTDGSSITSLGDDLFVIDSGRIQRTADLGRSWTACSTPYPTRRGDVRLFASEQSLLYWIPDGGLFRSRDRCATWAPVRVPWDVDQSVGVVLAPDAGITLVHTSTGWFRTTDQAQNWREVAGPAAQPLPSAADGRSTVVSGTDLVMGTTSGVFRSTDRGLSWSRIGFPRRWARAVVTREGVFYAAVGVEGSSPARTAMMRSHDNGHTWLPGDDGLEGHHVSSLTRDDSGTVYAAAAAGVYRLEPSGRWQHVGLPTFFPTFLFAAPWGDLYLGTDYSGAHRSRDGGATWRPLLLPHQLARSMTATARGDLLLAAGSGIVRSCDRGDTWEPVEFHDDARTLFTLPSTGVIVAGTRNRVFRSHDAGKTWQEDASGEDGVFPESFAGAGNGDLFMGTSHGDVYRLSETERAWRPLPSRSDGSPASALAVLTNGDVLAGTTFGLFRWKPGNDRWEPLALSREERPRVSSLILADSGDLVAATSAAGVLVSRDQGSTWRPANRGLATRRVRRMVLATGGELYVASGTNGLEYGDGETGGRIRIYRGRLGRSEQ